MNRITILFLFSLLVVTAGCHSQNAVKTSDQVTDHRTVLIPTLYFENNRVEIRDESLIDKNADWLKNHQDKVVILEGHCDERGDRNYNMLLGDRRARAVMQALMKRGIAENQLIIVSYGKDKPTSRGTGGWDQNRRVEFVVR